MKLFKVIAAAAVIGGSLITAVAPASAQYYGGSYGFNNGSPNSYGDFGNMNRSPRYGSPAYGSQQRGRSSSGCSSLSMSNYGC